MSEPRDAASSGEPAQADEAVEPVTPGQWGTFRTRADQRRLAQVQAAKREREAARARPDVSLSLDAGPAPVRPQQAGREVDSLATGKDRETFTILVVCTGNVCRSPYFERVLAADLARLPVRVEGAGTGALLIDRMSSGTQVLLRERGLDGARYRPRQVTSALVREADLVLTASREHRRVLVEEAPTAASRVFALLDFADVCAETPLPRTQGVYGLREFVANSPAGSVGRHSARSDADAEIPDPFRQGPEVFARMAAQADPALATVAAAVRRIMG
ncbi:hypothetical protein [Dermacoccus nishinomiyaensis]|uniref:arsenate reductase/protein-tyrosine-phosphatase family protein n=1 Tax=Dermacoccus nishinomiyaensis TaxID=1274 RepID=UPI00093C61B6|nr:hypothetical protein [Dermacoccus nishinomiyaensis]